ncbi:MAG: hypothetical protein OSJ71_00930 [Acetatifactor sp.]|nr:hypothetical protein [Acetatifactor sp.]
MEMEELKKKYWGLVKKTRKSGRISPSVIGKAEEQWKRFDESVVRQALEIHIQHYPSYPERYTLGIMRNLQRCKEGGPETARPRNSFNRFEQNKYDFEQLEKELLAN